MNGNEIEKAVAITLNSDSLENIAYLPAVIRAFLNGKHFTDQFEFGEKMIDTFSYRGKSDNQISIENLGNHVFAFIDTIYMANEQREEYLRNPDIPILFHEIIKQLNAQLFYRKYIYDEVGFGNYRSRDKLRNPVDVVIRHYDSLGNEAPLDWQPERVIKYNDKNIVEDKDYINTAMRELVNWVNGPDFKSGDPFEQVAKFHCRFIHIHPFRDGNGRTCRLLTNYLLYVLNEKMISIPKEKVEQYHEGINEGIKNQNYAKLINLFKECEVAHMDQLVKDIIENYDKHKNAQM